MKLNLGCGKILMAGWVNVDIVKIENPAHEFLQADLTNLWPWDDESITAIRADNLFEHFADEYIFVMNEAWRVLMSGSVMWWKVPNALDWPDGAMGDPTHKRFFTPRSFYYLNHERAQWRDYGSVYGLKPWKIASLKKVQGDKFFECVMIPFKEN